MFLADRDDPGHSFQVVLFDSFEEAGKHSGWAGTNEFAGKMMAPGHGEPTFHNLDIVEEREHT